jgi:hypothetical protein
VSKTLVVDTAGISIRNDNDSPVSIHLESIPLFISYNGPVNDTEKQKVGVINSGNSISFGFSSSSETLSAGVTTGEIVLGVADAGPYPGCTSKDIRLQATVNVSPTAELNQLGRMSVVGWTLATLVILASFVTAAWSFKERKHPVIKKMQPPFLLAILFGVVVLGSAIFPLSIDDGIASERGCDVSCMATPWLLSMGVCIVFSTLFSKLWRLNRLLGTGFRRFVLKEKDVILPAAIMFILNIIILLCWTVISPLQWDRVPVDSIQLWNTVGVCASENEAVEKGCWIAIGCINIGALILSCWQAYQARNHSDQLSEAKGIGFAMFSWFQLTLVGVPVLLLIDTDDVTARYFVQIGLVFLACM